MRFRLVLAGALAAALGGSRTRGRRLNPQHAGLQVALRAQGLYLGPIDAIIGPKTVAAVRAFQRGHGLHVTGIADLRTRRELGPLGTPLFGSRTLARGKFGWDVAVLQFLLDKHGVRVPVNAYMDTPTVAGLKRYQRAMHLRADGVAGPATFAALGLQTRVPVKRCRRAPMLTRYVVKPGRLADGDRAQARDDARRRSRSSTGSTRRSRCLIGVKLRIARGRARRARPRRCRRRTREPCATRSTAGRRTTASTAASRARSPGWSRATTTRRLHRRRAGRDAAPADDLGLRRERADRAPGRARRRRERPRRDGVPAPPATRSAATST